MHNFLGFFVIFLLSFLVVIGNILLKAGKTKRVKNLGLFFLGIAFCLLIFNIYMSNR